jgi:hypothetical protein
MPAFAEFEAVAGRQIPVIVLERVHNNAPSRPSPGAMTLWPEHSTLAP